MKVKLPAVNANGFYRDDKDKRGPPAEDEVETAVAYLSLVKPTKRCNNLNSYALKHDAEEWGGRNGKCNYVSNGALIAAAIRLGLRIKPCSDTSLNAYIGVSRSDVRRIGEELEQRRVGSDAWYKKRFGTV
jgi:hypothetical protein